MPTPSVLDASLDQSQSLWANSGSEATQASLRVTAGALASSVSSGESAAIIPIEADNGAVTEVIADRLAESQSDTLDFYAMKVTKFASIDEMPPTLARHFDKIQRFREMLKQPAGL